MMFQRRQGRQVLGGQAVEAVKDYAFVGAEGGYGPDDFGVEILDVTDPANPVLLAFRGRAEGLPLGVHNITVNADAGLVYLNMAEFDLVEPLWGYIDLTDPAFPVTTVPMRAISPSAGDGCHDSAWMRCGTWGSARPSRARWSGTWPIPAGPSSGP